MEILKGKEPVVSYTTEPTECCSNSVREEKNDSRLPPPSLYFVSCRSSELSLKWPKREKKTEYNTTYIRKRNVEQDRKCWEGKDEERE